MTPTLLPAPAGLYGLSHSAPGEAEKWHFKAPIVWMSATPGSNPSDPHLRTEYFDLDGDSCQVIWHEPSGHVYALGNRMYSTLAEWLDDQA